MAKNLFLVGIILATVGISLWLWKDDTYTFQATPTLTPKPTPLAKYTFKALKNRTYQDSEIKLERILKEEEKYTSYLFSFTTDGKRVKGQVNLPKKEGKLPVVIMLRGYIDKEVYFTGLGTRKAAGYFAENGFITVAPDFLGFGGSDWESFDILEARFEKPITVLNLLESIHNLPQADTKKLFLWGHSNGGQIALSVLEITGKPIPTTLWAPVTRPFPNSVTDFIGEMDDQGKIVLASISAFLKIYNPAEFSVVAYLQDINAPLQVHQGAWDPLVKLEWTNEFTKILKDLDKKITLYSYPRDDHNLSRNWDTVVERDLKFFKSHLLHSVNMNAP